MITEPDYAIGTSSKIRGVSKTVAKKKRQSDRYAVVREAVNLNDRGCSFATFFFVENDEHATVKRFVDVTSQLKVDTPTSEFSGKIAKPVPLRLTS